MKYEQKLLFKMKLFSNVSGLALHQCYCKYVRPGARFLFTYEVKIKTFLERGGLERSLRETEGALPGVSVARYPRGARASLMK